MSSPSQPSKTSTETVLPDWVQTAAQNNIKSANELADRPYEANPYLSLAPITEQQNRAYGLISDNVGAFDPYMEGATAVAMNAARSATPISYDDVAAGGASLLGGRVSPISAENIARDTQTLMNPYSDIVVDPSLALMRQELNRSLNATRANASNVGAFGGSRLGVEEGIATAQEALLGGKLKGDLLTDAWKTASGQASTLAGQNLQAGLTSNALAADIANRNQGFGMWGTTTAADLMGRQQQMVGRDAAALEAVGRTLQQQDQAQRDIQSTQWQDEWDSELMNQYIRQNALQSTPYSSTAIATGPQQRKSTAMGILGGAASGAAMGSMIAPGYGTAIGAAAGGLLGAFG